MSLVRSPVALDRGGHESLTANSRTQPLEPNPAPHARTGHVRRHRDWSTGVPCVDRLLQSAPSPWRAHERTIELRAPLVAIARQLACV
jgi:hypothetical protein